MLSAPRETYGDEYRNHLLEQYKLYIDSSLQVTNWRASANSFFLTISTALVSFYGVATALENASAWLGAICLVGIVLTWFWSRTIESYRVLNSAKFEVIHEIESHLPLKLFDREWQLRMANHQKTPTPTRAERLTPLAFALLNAFLFTHAVLQGVGVLDGIDTKPFEVRVRTTTDVTQALENAPPSNPPSLPNE